METLQKQYLFWDVELGKLNPLDHKNFIISRILALGDSDDFRWAVDYYGKSKIKDVFLKNIKKLDARSQNFFCSYFNLDKKQCIRKQLTRKRSAFWKK